MILDFLSFFSFPFPFPAGMNLGVSSPTDAPLWETGRAPRSGTVGTTSSRSLSLSHPGLCVMPANCVSLISLISLATGAASPSKVMGSYWLPSPEIRRRFLSPPPASSSAVAGVVGVFGLAAKPKPDRVACFCFVPGVVERDVGLAAVLAPVRGVEGFLGRTLLRPVLRLARRVWEQAGIFMLLFFLLLFFGGIVLLLGVVVVVGDRLGDNDDGGRERETR